MVTLSSTGTADDGEADVFWLPTRLGIGWSLVNVNIAAVEVNRAMAAAAPQRWR